MLDPNQFDETLRRLIKPETFVPFYIELDDGQKIWIKQPTLAFGGGGASFLDPDDGAMVSFYHEHVVAVYGPQDQI